MIEFNISGRPFARPTRKSTAAQEAEADRVMQEIREQYKREPLEGLLSVEFQFYFEPPASVSKKVRAEMLNLALGHVVRPHLDNLSKFYMDAMSGHLWADDPQVGEYVAFKAYAERAKTVIRVRKVTKKRRAA